MKKQNRFIVLFSIMTLLAIMYNIFFAIDQYRRVNNLQTFVAHHQSEILDAFILAFRQAYQETFIKNHVPLNEKNIKLLPVMTMQRISEIFTEKLSHKAIIRTVSDDPRNPENVANELEMKSIEYFKKHKGKKEQYALIEKDGEEQFYYASPLYIEKRCLKCHGDRRDAPEYIRTHYDHAYGYKVGDLRGIVSIYLSQDSLKASIWDLVSKNILKMVLITLIFLFVFYFLLKKIYNGEQKYTENLEKEVAKKTRALQSKSEELEYRFYHDTLTDLPNRNALINDLEKEEAKALILLNIDDFNEINDFYGHDAGDLLLKKLGALIQTKCPIETCRLYRMPTDEFALLIREEVTADAIEEYIKELISLINNHDFIIDDSNIVHLRIAVGASLETPTLMITADMAMKKAKADREDYVIYDDKIDLSEKYRKNLEWAEKLKTAIEEDRIEPWFQPIVSVKDGKIKMYEALIRIVDKDGTVHTPYQFLEIAKRTKFYPELTKRMVKKVAKLFNNLPYDISLNISYLDIVNKGTMGYIIDIFSCCDNASRVHFEILESEGIERYDDVYDCLKRLKSYGAHISIDDFGSGYSNFEHILKLEVDMLKIDGSLIKNIDKDIGSQIIVETIVDFASKMGIDTCAEFVSSKAVYDIVKDLGVTYVQGYYIGEPKPFSELDLV